MPPLKTHDFKIKQGEYFQETLAYKNPDGTAVILTGGTARLVARYKDAVVLDLTSVPPAGLTIDDSLGTITYAVTAAQSAGFDFNFAPYDMFFYPASGKPVCLEEGLIQVERSQTR